MKATAVLHESSFGYARKGEMFGVCSEFVEALCSSLSPVIRITVSNVRERGSAAITFTKNLKQDACNPNRLQWRWNRQPRKLPEAGMYLTAERFIIRHFPQTLKCRTTLYVSVVKVDKQ
jgi:hypothetical protein